MESQQVTQTVAEQVAREVAQAVARLLSTAGASVRQLLPVDRFYAVLYDAERDEVRFPVVLPPDDAFPAAPRRMDGARLPDWLVRQGEPAAFSGDGAAFRAALKERKLRYWPGRRLPLAWLGAPLAVEDQILGALVIENYRSRDAFGQTGPTLLATVARQAAVAIRNARLDGQMKRKAASLEVVNRLGQQLTAGIHLGEGEILQLLHENASQLMDTANMYVAFYDQSTDTVSFPLMLVDGRPMEVPARSGGRGRTEWIIRNRQPILIRTRAESEAWYKEHEGTEYIGEPFASWVGVPMLRGEGVLGVIATYHKSQDYIYDADDQLVLTLMAGQAAVAIENARLYANMEQMVAERTRAWLEERERADAAEKLALMSQVAAEFAHRMNNLAGTIPPRVEMARENLDPRNARDARVLKQLDSISRDARLLLDAAQEIKKSTEARAAEFVDVNAELEIALGRVWSSKPEAEGRIQVVKELSEGLPQVYAERNKLVDTLVSMIQNGVEAMPQGGTLTLATRRGTIKDRPCIEIAISDTGVGIPADHLPKIFDLFFTTKEKGLGFGLWRDRVFVRNLGGDIEVRSQVGKGTTFTIKIPVPADMLSSNGG